MPAKVNVAAAAAAGQVASAEPTEMKYTKAAKPKMTSSDKQSPQQQFNLAENKMMNNIRDENLQIPMQAVETSPVLSSDIRSKHQPQPDAYVFYPQYQRPQPIVHSMSVPVATANPTGQQRVLQVQAQISPTYQVAYQSPMNASESDSVVPSAQPYEFMIQPLQTCGDTQVYQYGWQYHSPPVMFPHQPYPDPCSTFNQFQQAVHLPTLRASNGCRAFQGASPDQTKQHHRHRNQLQRDPRNSTIACQKGQEYYCNRDFQTQPARPTSSARKEPEKDTLRADIPSITTEGANADKTRISQSSSDFTKLQSVSAMPSSPVRPAEPVGTREWYHRENNLSSDSGWISDNSSNREDGELVDDTASLSPTVNETSKHFQQSLCLDSSNSLSTDESYQESRFSSISSQSQSTSDDNEQQQTATKKHHQQQQQQRIMRAIPSRFVNLLHAAAENAAVLRKRLEGYPLFRHVMLQRRFEDHQQHGQVYGQEMQQLEFSLTNQHNQSTSWYFPGGYMQYQYHPNPATYIQGQYPHGAETCVQGPYHQPGYTQGQKTTGCYVQSQQGPGGYLQSPYNQVGENYSQSQYNQGHFDCMQPAGSYMCSDQQCGQEYCPVAQAVPVYVIQVDNPDVANSCALYCGGLGYADCNSYAAYEKQPQSHTYPSNPSYANPVPIQVTSVN